MTKKRKVLRKQAPSSTPTEPISEDHVYEVEDIVDHRENPVHVPSTLQWIHECFRKLKNANTLSNGKDIQVWRIHGSQRKMCFATI